MYNKYQAWELSLIALCCWREARNQGFDGMLAVAWSIRNRVMAPGKQWWGEDWEEVLLKRWQYTSFEKTDPNAVLLPGDPSTDKAWKDAIDCADRAYLGAGVDPTNGATHYYAVSIPPPKWVNAVGTVFKVQIGDHRFYQAL